MAIRTRYEIHNNGNKNEPWYVVTIGNNNEALSHSEQLSSKQNAKKNIRAQRLAALLGKVVEVK